MKTSSLFQLFKRNYYGVHNIRANDHGSLTSFKRVIRVNGNITRKTIIRIHYLRNEQEGIYYQRRLQHINPGHHIDID